MSENESKPAGVEKRPTPEEIERQLAGCTGTAQYHLVAHGLLATDGVKLMATLCGAFWLLDVVASYQPKCKRDPTLRAHQFWTLTVRPDQSATVVCERDKGDIAIRQEIPWTDFPLVAQKVWVSPGAHGPVAMLPSEY